MLHCVSAWNKDPVLGVIGVEKGPPEATGSPRSGARAAARVEDRLIQPAREAELCARRGRAYRGQEPERASGAGKGLGSKLYHRQPITSWSARAPRLPLREFAARQGYPPCLYPPLPLNLPAFRAHRRRSLG